MYPGGGAGVLGLGPATSFSHEPQTLLVIGSVVRASGQYLRVLLPIRPDGASGWISRDDVALSHTLYWVEVEKRSRYVLVYRAGVLVHRYRAVIGKAATPTPDGLATIYEKNPQADPTAFLGPWALPLTILSNVLTSYGGGPGRVAIHGRGGASLPDPLGSAASHGCIPIDNGPITWMAHHLPAGTPVQILQ